MKISTEIKSTSNIIGEERAVEAIAKAGFDAWDFSMFKMCNYDWGQRILLSSNHPLAGRDYLKFARKLKQIGLDNGIVCNQSHAPFPSYHKDIRSHFKRSIECTAEAGGKICIIHPDNYLPAEKNAEMYMELLPFAKECNVKIATENMWNWNEEENHASFAACSDEKDFKAHLDTVNDDFFVACLDIGHAEMFGLNTSSIAMINALGKKLQALHIHDNDLHNDSHQIPFSMSIDFEPIIKALKQNGYNGYFTLEADVYLNGSDESEVPKKLTDLKNAAEKLAHMFEKA